MPEPYTDGSWLPPVVSLCRTDGTCPSGGTFSVWVSCEIGPGPRYYMDLEGNLQPDYRCGWNGMTQLTLRLDPCLRGWHGQTILGEPIDKGPCINRDVICTRCAMVIGEESARKDLMAEVIPRSVKTSRGGLVIR